MGNRLSLSYSVNNDFKTICKILADCFDARFPLVRHIIHQMKSPIVIATLIVSVALFASVVIVIFPVYSCIYHDEFPAHICLHGRAS